MTGTGRRRRRPPPGRDAPAGTGAGTQATPGTDAEADPEEVARTIAFRQLATQPRSRAELARTFRRRGVADEVAQRVLDRLEELRLVDDPAFANAWVESRHAGRGLARRALAHELRRRGVGETDIGQAVDQLDPDTELATARALVERKLRATRGLAAPVRLRRLVGMLARKGYPSSVAAQVVREALASDEAHDTSADKTGASETAASRARASETGADETGASHARVSRVRAIDADAVGGDTAGRGGSTADPGTETHELRQLVDLLDDSLSGDESL